ncbi:MAG: hypothetical protein ABR585_15570, partial [Gemmatimonadaceae bacterium]
KKTVKKGSRPSPKKAKGKPKQTAKKISIDPRRLQQMRDAEKKRLAAERAREEKRVAAERDRVVGVPDGVSSELAAAAMLQGMTAHYLAFDSYPVQAGDWVVVHAAAGGVGLLLTQLVKLRGGRVIATTSSPCCPPAATNRETAANHIIEAPVLLLDDVGPQPARRRQRKTNGHRAFHPVLPSP